MTDFFGVAKLLAFADVVVVVVEKVTTLLLELLLLLISSREGSPRSIRSMYSDCFSIKTLSF